MQSRLALNSPSSWLSAKVRDVCTSTPCVVVLTVTPIASDFSGLWSVAWIALQFSLSLKLMWTFTKLMLTEAGANGYLFCRRRSLPWLFSFLLLYCHFREASSTHWDLRSHLHSELNGLSAAFYIKSLSFFSSQDVILCISFLIATASTDGKQFWQWLIWRVCNLSFAF